MTVEEMLRAGKNYPLIRGIVLTEEQSAAVRATVAQGNPFANPFFGIPIVVLPDDEPAPEGFGDFRHGSR